MTDSTRTDEPRTARTDSRLRKPAARPLPMNPTADVRACVPLSLYAPTSQQDPALLAEGRDGDRNEPWLRTRGSHIEDQVAAAATPGCL
jgi:hypothetical protein